MFLHFSRTRFKILRSHVHKDLTMNKQKEQQPSPKPVPRFVGNEQEKKK